jgi:hypothetical protein
MMVVPIEFRPKIRTPNRPSPCTSARTHARTHARTPQP